MDRIHAFLRGQPYDAFVVEIGLDRPLILADQIRFVGFKAMQCETVFFGVDRNRPQTDRHGVDEYMVGLVEYAQAIVPGSTEVVEAVGDDKRALLTVNARIKFGPDAPEMDAPAARMYVLDEDGKIKIEHVVFFVS